MSRKHLSLLSIAVVLVVGAILLLLPGKTGNEPAPTQVLLPGLSESVNDIERIDVITAGNVTKVSLERGEEGWTINQLSSYGADMEKIRDVLAGLARAEVMETKTANAEYYSRLGVEPMNLDNATGSRLDLEAGDQRWSLIVGNEAPSRGGHYLRVADQEQSVLADFEADVPDTPVGWADDSVVDMGAGVIAELQLRYPDGETLTVSKVSADDTDFTLAELPEGREVQSAWSVNSLGGVLAGVTMENVAPEASIDWSEAITIEALTFGGMQLQGALARQEEADWLRLSVSAPEQDSEIAPDSSAADEAANVDQDLGTGLLADAVTEQASQAEAINRRVVGWAYQIPSYKADAMDKRLDDLLVEEDLETSTDP